MFVIGNDDSVKVNKGDAVSFNVNYSPASSLKFETGDTLTLQIKKASNQAGYVKEKVFTVFDAETGFNVNLSSAENDLPVGEYVYTLKKTDIGLDVVTIFPELAGQLAKWVVYE